MAHTRTNVAALDPVWSQIVTEAHAAVADEPLLGGLVHACVLHHAGLEAALAYRIAQKLASPEMSEQLIREIADAAYVAEPALVAAARADIAAVYERDPACHRYLQPLLYFKGFHAIQAHRIAHWLWNNGRRDLAYFFQMRVSEKFSVDIHPACRIGKGIFLDHAHSLVFGETAVIGDNVSILHSVTLGGTGKEDEDRHPKIGDGVLIGAGAKLLLAHCCGLRGALRCARCHHRGGRAGQGRGRGGLQTALRVDEPTDRRTRQISLSQRSGLSRLNSHFGRVLARLSLRLIKQQVISGLLQRDVEVLYEKRPMGVIFYNLNKAFVGQISAL